jgi:hypothetical protein
VTLADGIGAPLATLYAGAMNQGAHSFAWRQVAVPDGIYRITISAQGTSGKQVSQTTTFYVDRNLVGVKAVPLVISPNGDGLFDETVVSFGLVAPAVARVEVWQSGRRLASLFGQTLQAGPLEQKWDGRIGGKVARDGKYDLVVRTTDPITTVTETRTVTVDTTAPRVRLVSLRRMRFWISEAATVTASFGRRRVSKAVKPGYFSFPLFRGRVAHFGLTATDRVGNRSARLRG